MFFQSPAFPRRPHEPSAALTGRLLQRNLVEYVGQGPEGGRYECPLGKVDLSEDGKQLYFRLQPAPAGGALPALTGYDVSQRLLALAGQQSPCMIPWLLPPARVPIRNVSSARRLGLFPRTAPSFANSLSWHGQ